MYVFHDWVDDCLNLMHENQVLHKRHFPVFPLAVVPNLTRELKTLKDNGFWIYGADMSGEDSYTADFPARTAIVMGSEGDGISQLVRKNCDYIVSIPMRGHIDSLNVSVAAGILLYEFRRPRNQEMK